MQSFLIRVCHSLANKRLNRHSQWEPENSSPREFGSPDSEAEKQADHRDAVERDVSNDVFPKSTVPPGQGAQKEAEGD